MCSSMGNAKENGSASKGSQINKAGNEVRYGNTKYTITQASNGYYLNIADANGSMPTKKYKIAYAKDENKARAYIDSFIGYLEFASDENMLKLLRNAVK